MTLVRLPNSFFLPFFSPYASGRSILRQLCPLFVQESIFSELRVLFFPAACYFYCFRRSGAFFDGTFFKVPSWCAIVVWRGAAACCSCLELSRAFGNIPLVLCSVVYIATLFTISKSPHLIKISRISFFSVNLSKDRLRTLYFFRNPYCCSTSSLNCRREETIKRGLEKFIMSWENCST